MMKYFMTDNQVIHEEEKLQDGVWVRMISPTQEECEEIADVLNVDIDDIKAALDEEESSRIELQDGYTLILVDVPTTEIRHDKQSYTTIPLGIILTQDVIVTVCTEDTPVLKNFVINRVKEFSTKKRLRFVYQILYRTATIYQTNLRIIDKRRTEIEERIGQHTEDVDLIDLHELESTLVYFATSLRANGVVLGMFGGNEQTVTLRFENRLLGVVLDRFGEDVPIRREDADTFQVRVRVAVSPQFLSWVFSFGGGARIVSPAAVADTMREQLASVMKQYTETEGR